MRGWVLLQQLLLVCCLVSGSTAQKFYSLDGSGEGQPASGRAGSSMLTVDVKELVTDGTGNSSISMPAPRLVSYMLANVQASQNNTKLVYPEKKLSSMNTTAMLTYMGQLVSHDLTKKATKPTDTKANFEVPTGDVWYQPNGTERAVPFTVHRDGLSANSSAGANIANNATAFVDLSWMYTTSAALLGRLRTKKDGMMVMDADGKNLALASTVFTDQLLSEEGQDFEWVRDMRHWPRLRATGDSRGNQNPGNLALRTLFFRNHNRLAAEAKQDCPQCSDEELFQRARRWNIATFQAITFYEYLPQLGIRLADYTGHKPEVQPGVDLFFTTVAYRYGHSEVTDSMWRLNEDGSESAHGHLALADAWYNADVALAGGVEPLLLGMARQLQGEVEPHFAPAVQHHMFGPAAFNGSDLFSINIFRGREHALPLYNAVRESFGLARKASFQEVTSKPYLQQLLAQVYASPDECDSYVCGLAEDKISPTNHFGELFQLSMTRQYERTRDGDPMYFENKGPEGPGFSEAEIAMIRSSFTMQQLILNNTSIQRLPDNVWNTGGGSESSGQRLALNQQSFLNGRYLLTWQQQGDRMEFTASVDGSGWIGLGIARGEATGMMDADMAVIHQVDGNWVGEDFISTQKASTPQPDTRRQGHNDVQLIAAGRQDGRTVVRFCKPLRPRQNDDESNDRPITPDKAQWMILAFHPTEVKFDGTPHPPSSRQIALIDWTATSNAAGQTDAMVAARFNHGALMSAAFVLLLPLGALLARGLRYNFIRSVGVKAVLFYMHIAMQITGVALSSAGLAIAVMEMGKNVKDTMYHHGTIGIVIMTMVYLQVLVGVFRPQARKDGTVTALRGVWDIVHYAFGRLVLLVALGNVFVGLHIYTSVYQSDKAARFGAWAVLLAVVATGLAWLQFILDRLETLYVVRRMAIIPEADHIAKMDNATLAAHTATLARNLPPLAGSRRDVSPDPYQGLPEEDPPSPQQAPRNKAWFRKRG